MFVIDHRPQAHNGGIETHALPKAVPLPVDSPEPSSTKPGKCVLRPAI